MDWVSAFIGVVLFACVQAAAIGVFLVADGWKKRTALWRERIEREIANEREGRWALIEETNKMFRDQLAMIKDLDKRVNELRVRVDALLKEES